MNKKGFTLLELLVVIVIIALMATALVPNLRTKQPSKEREEFSSRLNALMSVVWNRAAQTGLIHRVWLDKEKNQIYLEQQDKKKSTRDAIRFMPYKSTYTKSRIKWPAQYDLKNFFLGTKDELVGKERNFKVFFVIMPDGLCQEVIMNFVDKKDTAANKAGAPASLVVNPFTAQFTLYDAFQKP